MPSKQLYPKAKPQRWPANRGTGNPLLAEIDSVWDNLEADLGKVIANSAELPFGIPRLLFEHTGARAMSFSVLLCALIQHVPTGREFWDAEEGEEIEFDDAESLARRLIEIDLEAGELYLDPRSQLLRVA